MEWNTILLEIIKAIIQLVILGLVGGLVSRYYSKIQKNREIKISLTKDISRIYGQFLAIRYEFNTFHLKWDKDTIKKIAQPIQKDEADKLKWNYYCKSCHLIAEYDGIKSLLLEFYPKEKEKINFIHARYQDWRRFIRDDKPIYQEINGKTHQNLKEMKNMYRDLIKIMKESI